jgi:hypothetical protein
MLTLPTHPDFENLERASKEIQEVADRINEIKRRKDIVEKIVGDRRRTDVSVRTDTSTPPFQGLFVYFQILLTFFFLISFCRWCKL